MSRKQRDVGQTSVTPSPPHLVTLSPPRGLMLAWLVALFASRWLMPTEGAIEGLTLWLVQLVLFTAAARAVLEWRCGDQRERFAAMDAAMGLLILAQAVSALRVVFGVGDARAAINVAWEWVGSGVLIGMLRHELTSRRVVRQLCLGLSLAAVVLAGFGLWQHYVGYREMSRDYDRLISEHDRLAERLRGDGVSPVSVSAADLRKLESLRAEMARQRIPIEKSARQSLEWRVKSSTEPLGLFALANSFAGLLIVMGLILVGLLGGSRSSRCLVASVVALIAFCVLLTKSRTAYAGLFAGMGWWLLRWVIERGKRAGGADSPLVRRRFGVWILVGTCVVGSAVGLAAWTGGLDRAVLSEAPQSFRYRLEWWQGTWATIRDHFWLGTGPGNFRDHYLPHKLPESSEEIADPHNFLLDVWANAGTLGLIGLLACIGLMVRPAAPSDSRSHALRGNEPSDASRPESATDRPTAESLRASRPQSGGATFSRGAWERVSETEWLSPAVWGVGLAFPLSALGMEFVGHGNDERLWWLGGIWWSLWLIGVVWSQRRGSSWKPETPAKDISTAASLALQASKAKDISTATSLALQASMRLPVALEAANVALLVHLLGAGGIAMPAITQLLWLVWGMRTACRESAVGASEEKTPSESRWRGVLTGQFSAAGCALVAVALSAVCLWTATMPELLCRTLLQTGDFEWGRRQIDSAQARYLEAVEADRWAIEPHERLADVGLQRWQQTQVDSDFERVIQRLQAVQERLPFASRTYRRLGQAWMSRFDRSHSPDHARIAAESFAAAVERYPHHAALLSEWAIACEGAGISQMARDAARRAIQQDDINRRAGHSDKFLSADVRRRMEQLAG